MLLAAATLVCTLFFVGHTGLVFSAKNGTHNPVVLFFGALMGLSAVLAWLSIWLPINGSVLVFLLLLVASTTLVRLPFVKEMYRAYFGKLRRNKGLVVFATMALVIFSYALTAEITLFDTGLYHTQAIKWIREYAVVPGLGNIHGRFAFNSHFFVLSALFTVETKTILIYPINAAALLVLLVYLVHHAKRYFLAADLLKATTYAIAALFCLFLYPSWLNAPSPDIISAVLVIYAISYFWETKSWQFTQLIFLTSIILTAIVIKLSSVFLGLLLIPAIFSYIKNFSTGTSPSLCKRGAGVSSTKVAGVSSITSAELSSAEETSPSLHKRGGQGVSSSTDPSFPIAIGIKRGAGVSSIIAAELCFAAGTDPSLPKRGAGVSSISLLLISLLILTPFFIRNYYLSGYLVYPYPQLDVFAVDWKMPKNIVEAEKLHIATWAKAPRMADETVAAMKMNEWLPIWWQRKSMPFKILLAGNVLSLLAFFTLFAQKKKSALVVFTIIWVNILFWFFTAPDPRFAHGFLIFGFAMGQGALLSFALSRMKKHIKVQPQWLMATFSLFVLLAAITIRENQKKIFISHLIYPKSMPSNPLAFYNKPFPHAVPITDRRCHNAALPCLPEHFSDVTQRQKEIGNGFMSKN